ncbi:MAG TPA: hypothetical protein VGF28_13590 [Thermoanaerobaculia bacterium]|jgi:hypothetical protein
MQAAAFVLFAIQCLEGDAAVHRQTEYSLAEVAKPSTRGLAKQRSGDTTVYSAAIADDGLRLLRLYLQRGDAWWQLQEERDLPVIEDRLVDDPAPIAVGRERGLLAVTYSGVSLGANTYARISKTVLIDDSGPTPRVQLMVECNEWGGGGACTAPDAVRRPRERLQCDERLHCQATITQFLDWTTRTATRDFDLLTGTPSLPERLGHTTYASGAAYARAFAVDPAVLGQHVLIDRIGPVTPIFELAPDSILFAAPAKEARVAVRFFHLTKERWREIPLVRLADAGYPGEEKHAGPASLADADTPAEPPLHSNAWNIEYNGKGRLLEVVARAGESRSLYWIMFDPNGRTSAIRLATDTPEFRHCDDRLYPPSITSIGIPDRGLPAQLTAIRSWRRNEQAEGKLPKHCPIAGTLGWSTEKGWQPRFVETPCTNPWTHPLMTVLDDEGNLGARTVTLDN